MLGELFGRLLCSNVFDYAHGALPQLTDVIFGSDGQVVGDALNRYEVRFEQGVLWYSQVVNGASLDHLAPQDSTMHKNDLTILHPSISRVSTDDATSRVRVSLLARNEHGRNIYAIIDVGVVDDLHHHPQLESGSVRRAGRIEATDPATHSVLHGTFIDPDYLSMPHGVVSNRSLFYWVEWPRRAEILALACATAPTSSELHVLAAVPATDPDARPAVLNGVACATTSGGDLHVLAVDGHARLWHTLRSATSLTPWSTPLTDVLAAVPGLLPHEEAQCVACATDPNTNDLHVLVIDAHHNVLWHTLRSATDPNPWSATPTRVQATMAGAEQGGQPGLVIEVACATDPTSGDLHVLVVDAGAASGMRSVPPPVPAPGVGPPTSMPC